MKALGHGIGEVDPLDIEVRAIEGQAPELHLHREAAAMSAARGFDSLALSLSYDADYAVAFVVALDHVPGDNAGTARNAVDHATSAIRDNVTTEAFATSTPERISRLSHE